MDDINMKRFKDEFVIDIKDMLWKLLQRWKAAVAFSLIFMILFSGLMCLKSSSAADNVPVKTTEEILAELSPESQNLLSGLIRETDAVMETRDYINNSPMMDLDPFNVNCLTMIWMITSDEDINRQISASLVEEMSSNSLADALAEAWGGDYTSEMARDLIYARSDFPEEADAQWGNSVIYVNVYLPDTADADKTSDIVEGFVADASADINERVGSHSAVLANSEYKTTYDADLSTRQFEVYDRYNSLNSNVSYIKNNILNAEQKAAYESIMTIRYSDPSNVADDVKPALSTKNMVIGFILGFILYAGIFVLYYIFSGKIFCTAVLGKTYGLRTLGEWYADSAKSGLLGKLSSDSFVYKKAHKNHLDMEAEATRICESVRSYFKLHDYKTLLLISNDMASKFSALTDAVSDKLKQDDISVVVRTFDNSAGVPLLESDIDSCDVAAVIVDEENTKVGEVQEAVEKCYYCKKPLMGAIYIG